MPSASEKKDNTFTLHSKGLFSLFPKTREGQWNEELEAQCVRHPAGLHSGRCWRCRDVCMHSLFPSKQGPGLLTSPTMSLSCLWQPSCLPLQHGWARACLAGKTQWQSSGAVCAGLCKEFIITAISLVPEQQLDCGAALYSLLKPGWAKGINSSTKTFGFMLVCFVLIMLQDKRRGTTSAIFTVTKC